MYVMSVVMRYHVQKHGHRTKVFRDCRKSVKKKGGPLLFWWVIICELDDVITSGQICVSVNAHR